MDAPPCKEPREVLDSQFGKLDPEFYVERGVVVAGDGKFFSLEDSVGLVESNSYERGSYVPRNVGRGKAIMRSTEVRTSCTDGGKHTFADAGRVDGRTSGSGGCG